MKSKHEKQTYSNYLKSLDKKILQDILDFYEIAYKVNASKETYENLIIDNVEKMVTNILTIFQYDEYLKLKLIVNKKGIVKTKSNYLINAFLKTLEKNHFAYNEENTYYVFDEVLKFFQKELKSKKFLNTTKENTEKYNLILGYTEVYGIIDLDSLYVNFKIKYPVEKEEFISYIKKLSSFFEEIKIFTDKKTTYIANNIFRTKTSISRFTEAGQKYYFYTNDEIILIHTGKYFEKKKTYKKLIKYINKNYKLEKKNYKIINYFVLMPYFSKYQVNEPMAKKELIKNIKSHFEIKSEKQLNKFITLIEEVAKEYPKWKRKES